MSDTKIALITGAAGGLGRAAATALRAAGANLVLVDRDARSLAETADRFGADALAHPGDVADAASVRTYFAAAIQHFGRVDIVFNNAGIEGEVSPTTDYADEMFDRVMAVNVRGVWLNLKAGITAIRAGGRGGVIINTGSGASLIGSPGISAYVASKHAVLGLTRTAALEVAAEGIRINCICPGPTDTRMMASLGDQMLVPRKDIEAAIPMRRYGRVEEIAATIAFLASEAASFITGAAISVDGGLTAQ